MKFALIVSALISVFSFSGTFENADKWNPSHQQGQIQSSLSYFLLHTYIDWIWINGISTNWKDMTFWFEVGGCAFGTPKFSESGICWQIWNVVKFFAKLEILQRYPTGSISVVKWQRYHSSDLELKL